MTQPQLTQASFAQSVSNYTHDLNEDMTETTCGIHLRSVPLDVDINIACGCGRCYPVTCPWCQQFSQGKAA